MDKGASDVGRFQLVAVRCRDLDVIAEHIVVPNLERADPGLALQPCLKLDDDAPRVVSQRAQLVELWMLPSRDKPAIARKQRQIGPEQSREFLAERRRPSQPRSKC